MGGQITGKDPYFNPKRARATLTGVLLMHIGLIAVPLIYSSLTDFFDPPLIVMKVGLTDLPLGDSPDAGAAADVPQPKSSEPEPDVSVDDLPNPQKVDDLPPDIPPPPRRSRIRRQNRRPTRRRTSSLRRRQSRKRIPRRHRRNRIRRSRIC